MALLNTSLLPRPNRRESAACPTPIAALLPLTLLTDNTLWRDLNKVISILSRGPETDMSRPESNPDLLGAVGGEHSSKELFEQLINSYSKHLNMNPRQRHFSQIKKYLIQICKRVCGHSVFLTMHDEDRQRRGRRPKRSKLS